MSDVNKDEVAEKLQRALAASSTTETVMETPTEEATTEEGGENRIPQSRFNEVNAAAKLAREEATRAQTVLAETQDKLVRMAELLEAKEADVRTLNEIKSFVNDPEMKDHVIAIDQKLKGIETIKKEVNAGTTTPEDAYRQTQELLEEARAELRDTQADVQADQLIAKADVLAERLLSALPAEYNSEDLAVINDLFHEKVDWDAAVADPSRLTELLTAGFQATIDRYGMPRGALFNAEEVEVLTPTATETPLTPEEEFAELMKLDWGSTKEVKLPSGKTTVTPERSDDDFNAVLAQAIRLAHAKK